MPDLVREALLIAAKDLTIEWRTRTAFVSAAAFAVLVLAVIFFSRDPTAVSASAIAPGALWVTLVFATMLGMHRAFGVERERRAMDALLLSPASRDAVFWGKWLGNLAFVGTIEALALPVAFLFYDLGGWHRLPLVAGVILLATVAFVAVGTLVGAMTARTRHGELLLVLLLLPFLFPPAVAGVQVTARVLEGRPLSEVQGWLKLTAAFDIVFLTLAALLFPATLDE
jgi:heme exporter protein B